MDNKMDWAREQCRLYVCNCYDPEEQAYRQLCCESALKVYEALLNDGHSGMSWGIVSGILKTLLDDKPLVKVEDKESQWAFSDIQHDGVTFYNHKYYPKLHKSIDSDGTVHFTCIDRVVCHQIESPNRGPVFYNGFVTSVVDELYPITFPFNPSNTITVCVNEYLTDPANGDYDTLVIDSIMPKHGATRLLGWAYKETEKGWKKIDTDELRQRIKIHYARENFTPYSGKDVNAIEENR